MLSMGKTITIWSKESNALMIPAKGKKKMNPALFMTCLLLVAYGGCVSMYVESAVSQSLQLNTVVPQGFLPPFLRSDCPSPEKAMNSESSSSVVFLGRGLEFLMKVILPTLYS